MTFLPVLAITTVLVLILRKPLKRHPSVFYVFAFALTGVYLYASVFGAPVLLWRYLLFALQRCTAALALFTLVMFAGVFSPESKAHSLLYPLRRELSIIGCILACGHIVAYLKAFAPRLLDGITSMAVNLTLSLAVSLILTVLLAVLTVTSFVVVRNKMQAARWKQIQTLAYPFYLLILLHLILVLLPSALTGVGTVAVNLVVYVALFCGYTVLRIRRSLLDRKRARLGFSL
ncbi:MAG: ferric reductase-like transmembrane domain-containing protein [Coriobacteriales bacterium]|nr:ferric reductase-like transmembrane domain-containing protein [Coriobacteriales bacterium]